MNARHLKRLGLSIFAGLALLGFTSNVMRPESLADGFHLPNFYQPTVAQSWAKVKIKFQFPELPKGKTWSDGFPLGAYDKRIRSHKTMRKNTSRTMVLKSVIKKMIAIYKFTDPYNFAYDSPPWMRSLAERERSVVEAKEVLVEIGVGAIPYLWEELVQNARFENHARKKGIELFRDAQQAVAMANEALVDAVRIKDPRLSELEDELEKGTVAFWKLDSLIGSGAGKLNAQYVRQTFELKKLIHDHARTDEKIKKLKEEADDAKIKLRQALGKCPGDYTAYQGANRISDAFAKRLRDTLLTFGVKAKNFLLRQAKHRNPNVRNEVVKLLKSLQELEAKAMKAKAKAKETEKLNLKLKADKQENAVKPEKGSEKGNGPVGR